MLSFQDLAVTINWGTGRQTPCKEKDHSHQLQRNTSVASPTGQQEANRGFRCLVNA
jgi:hypothetical protein